MTKHDIDQVVGVHLESFKGFFLTFLGRRFLRVFYSFMIFDAKSISIVAEYGQNNQVIAFVVGALEPSSFYSRAIRARIFQFACASFPAFIKNPRILGRLIRALVKPKEMKTIPADCELMSIAVLPQYANQGIGRELEAFFINEAKRHNVHAITLTTDKFHNDGANKFYEKCGYVVYNTYVTPEGREMNRYIKILS